MEKIKEYFDDFNFQWFQLLKKCNINKTCKKNGEGTNVESSASDTFLAYIVWHILSYCCKACAFVYMFSDVQTF